MHRGEKDTDDENEAFLPVPLAHDDYVSQPCSHCVRKRRTWSVVSCLRIVVELAMIATIVFLLAFRPSTLEAVDEDQSLKRTPVPHFPKKVYKFHNDPRYTREDMFFNESATLHTLHNWIELSSTSRGYVVFQPSWDRYDLPKPYTVAIDRQHDGPGYMVSLFHQLHCLSYLAEHFQQGYGGVKLDEEVAHHSAHCFNYIRQGIMCAADTTLEGETKDGPGEGSEHVCKDYEKVLEWANQHAAYRWREGLLPGESIL
ncbi:uncharacterized protein EI97DRAFT_377412 [Westerdykella ornata]|uniref:Oxidase ustYa n=1 Tax=Westerdykella ornata TaxID=318751 RepID=A0A6A6JJA7_WESOR|nr:uncharacterized protein EI97DRAFT_377412 [Westerdykella ornata]KAF2276344.1 hypothetical protein EI97DRAFT_377412 [Westerdykella ornata]